MTTSGRGHGGEDDEAYIEFVVELPVPGDDDPAPRCGTGANTPHGVVGASFGGEGEERAAAAAHGGAELPRFITDLGRVSDPSGMDVFDTSTLRMLLSEISRGVGRLNELRRVAARWLEQLSSREYLVRYGYLDFDEPVPDVEGLNGTATPGQFLAAVRRGFGDRCELSSKALAELFMTNALSRCDGTSTQTDRNLQLWEAEMLEHLGSTDARDGLRRTLIEVFDELRRR